MSLTVVTRTGGQTILDSTTLNAFQQPLRGSVLLPSAAGYDEARKIWNAMIDRKPALIVRCHGTADVIDTVNFARTHDLLLSVRGGGHNVAGNAVCEGGLMLDLSPMKGIHVDGEQRRVRVQGGATWGEVDRETQAFGLATPGGVVSITGVAGLTLGGGLGWLRRKYGLACDNLRSVEIVTADGQLRTASSQENADLFWGIQGGGGNFGVVTSFEFQLHPVGPEVMLCNMMYPLEEAHRIVPAWRDFLAGTPDEVSSICTIWSVPAVDPIPQALWNKEVVGVGAMYAGDPAEGEKLLQPLRELAEPVLDMSGRIPYRTVQTLFDPFFPVGRRYFLKSTDLRSLDDEVIEAVLTRAGSRPTHGTLLVFWAYGGAINRVAMADSAFASRTVPCMYSVDGVWDDPQDDERCINWVRQYIDFLKPYSSGGFYSNFAGDPEPGPKLYGPNHQRLVDLKNKYDPQNFFRMNQNIKPTV